MAVSTARAALGGLEIGALDPTGYEAAIPSLAALIVDAVEGGASVNFMAGVTEAEAAQWWQARIPDVADGTITAFIAKEPATNTVVGSTILIRSRNTNAPHRAEIGKVLGIARSVAEASAGC